MAHRFVADFSDGETVDEILLVRDKQVRANRSGSQYLQLDLSDRTGSISARFWNASDHEAHAFDAGDYLRVKGKVQLFQSQLQLIVQTFDRVEKDRVDPRDFVPSTDQDIDALLADLRESLGRIADPALAAIAKAFLADQAFLHAYSQAPAGVRNHHAYLGGLLEHVVNLLHVAERILDLYPSLDRDMVLMGVFLHDVGKLRELSYEEGFSYTDEGQLIGHLVIGVEMLNEKLPAAEKILGKPLPVERVLALKHLIVSHHGEYEYGSPKLPMTPEAIALHHLDNLDAKVHNFSRTIRDDPDRGSAWTPYDPSLGRRLFKGRPAAPPDAPAPRLTLGEPKNLKGGL